MINPIVQQCWDVREKLVKKFGGLDGWFDELERLDRKRLAAEAAKKKAKRAMAASKKPAAAKPLTAESSKKKGQRAASTAKNRATSKRSKSN